ncbi:nicolin-1 isoform X4 [Anarhichas minor]|uniref:nicolin-1 isoform X4 n=1 Tax=Anarhichas minor TaxID=65739 RepID=UPI003F735AC3
MSVYATSSASVLLFSSPSTQRKKMSGSSDDIKPVSCTIKPPVHLQIGDTKADAAHSGVCVVDVTLPFGKPVNHAVRINSQSTILFYIHVSGVSLRHRLIKEITFKNYYTAYVTVRLLRRSPGQEAPAKWCTALRDLPLMDNPHTEGGSQDYCSVHRAQVGCEAWFVRASAVEETKDAGGAGSCGLCETDPETAVLCLAHLQPGRHQHLPSRGADGAKVTHSGSIHTHMLRSS